MKKILSASLGSSEKNYQFTASFLNQKFQITRIGCDGDLHRLKQTIRDFDGQVDAIGLGGISAHFKVSNTTHIHQEAQAIIKTAQKSPVADGRGLKAILQAWTVRHINQKYKDFFTNENILFLSGISHYQMALVLQEYTSNLSFCDPIIHPYLKSVDHSHSNAQYPFSLSVTPPTRSRSSLFTVFIPYPQVAMISITTAYPLPTSPLPHPLTETHLPTSPYIQGYSQKAL